MIRGYVRELGRGDRWANRGMATPEGFRLVIVDEFARGRDSLDWQRLTEPKNCRFTVGPGHQTCKRPAVLGLRRGRGGVWGYCERHLFGRRWDPDTGQLLTSILVANDEQP